MSGRGQRGRGRFVVVVAGVLVLSASLAVPTLAAEPAGPSPAAQEARRTPLVPGTPCTITASACVDLESQRAWLFEDGKIVRGPVNISSGGNGTETPVGHSLRVYRKEKDHKSQESRLPNGQPAPMPWAVFFEHGGIAFHGGDPNRSSAGCIHVPPAHAQAWFEHLQIGDQVQVVKASEELAARTALAQGDGSGESADGSDNSDDGDSDDDDSDDDGDSGDGDDSDNGDDDGDSDDD